MQLLHSVPGPFVHKADLCLSDIHVHRRGSCKFKLWHFWNVLELK